MTTHLRGIPTAPREQFFILLKVKGFFITTSARTRKAIEQLSTDTPVCCFLMVRGAGSNLDFRPRVILRVILIF